MDTYHNEKATAGSSQPSRPRSMASVGHRTISTRSSQRSNLNHTGDRGRCAYRQTSATPLVQDHHNSPSATWPEMLDCFKPQAVNPACGNVGGYFNPQQYTTPTLASDMAQGERISAHSPVARQQERCHDHPEIAGCSAATPHSPGSAGQLHKSLLSYRTVLAKRGLLVKDTLGSGSYSKVKHACYVKYADAATPALYPSDVAVKIIDRTIAPKDFQQKFLPRELDIWPRIRHRNIIQMLEWFTEGHRVYMILEYVRGGDALKFIQTSGAVSETVGKTWTRQVADAVKYLHDLDIMHRDLKLENMLIDGHNNVKLCDFGFVKQCGDSELSRTFCGSKSYAAPEILKGERYPPKKADVWAIGVILFILVTGRMPFDETKGNASLLQEHQKLELQWPKGRKTVSSQCKAAALYCLKFPWLERPNINQFLGHTWFRTR